MTGFDEATRRQQSAAEPSRSTWLSANAGSGKTRVLTDRAARLLLSGVPPERILCVTYTKAAAAEMQNRLFARLGVWAMLDDKPLSAALNAIGETELPSLDEARTLFARAIETPGGLKVQTIHSFCAAILRRFPLEAGVAPDFSEIDEAAAGRLISETIRAIAVGPNADTLEDVGRHMSGDRFEDIARAVISAGQAFPADATSGMIPDLFGLPNGFSADSISASAFDGSEKELFTALLAACRSGSPTDIKAAAKLAPIEGRALGAGDLPLLEGVLLFGETANSPFGPKVGNFPTKATRKVLGPICDALDSLMIRVADARSSRLALLAAERTESLHRFARVFLPAYHEAKAARGLLDFDDLISKTRDLLSKSASASWVLYKLDGGIDHVLVDEAQDTSPAQWDVISQLCEEMLAGEGVDRPGPRTIFVVGDKKQSIYSFQGADPDEFDLRADDFETQLATSAPLARRELVHSFRSSEAVLRVVDQTYFRDGTHDLPRHRAFFPSMPGRVDLWQQVAGEDKIEPDHWWDPVDLPGTNHPSVLLSLRIAGFIEHTIASETLSTVNGRRAIHAGDFLILVQGRKTPLFHNLIRALKVAGIPVAGADRLRLSAELAVKDLLSVLRFLSLPEDDLALAEALRSPLFGLTEGELHKLCFARRTYLWAALRDQRADFEDTHRRLMGLLEIADFKRPFELLEEILTVQGGRSQLIARLGVEAEDGIDLLLSQALAYETSEIPSLTGFVEWAQGGEAEIRRQADQSGRQVRVMTVHGAKGLEAPIVILPDTIKPTQRIRDEILISESGVALWKKGPKSDEPPPIADARIRIEDRDREERRRLLYVAMTRAENWLVVCGAGKNDEGTWYSDIARAMNEIGAVETELPGGPGLRFSHAEWGAGNRLDDGEDERSGQTPPPWLDRPARTPRPTIQTLTPSELSGAKALPGEEARDRDTAMAYGTALHQLLEHLPQHDRSEWPELAQSLCEPLPCDELLSEASAILSDQSLDWIFAADSLAEVQITAEIAELGGHRIHGSIDRLIVSDSRIVAVDFKSNRVVPESADSVPLGILRQLGAYAAALSQIYPGLPVIPMVLWTAKPQLMEVPHDIVMDALRGTATS